MINSYFEILRPGINTTIQDAGRHYLHHIGITTSGAIDQRNYKFANKLTNNTLNEPAIEFAYQGPLLRLKNGKVNFVITGDIFFNIIRNNSKIEEGKCYQNYILSDGEEIDIISTKNSAYGYLSVSGGFQLEKTWNSYSINTKAQIGPNDGKKYSIDEKIFIKKSTFKNIIDKKIHYRESFNTGVEYICQTTVPIAISCFLQTNDYESCIRLAISSGGDTDTVACMAGGIAAAFYGGIPQQIKEETLKRIPEEFKDILNMI